MTQQTLGLTLPALPARHIVTGVDPGKDMLWCATVAANAGGMIDALRVCRFEQIPWCTTLGWRETCALFWPGPGLTGFVLCESQWADADAASKWSGLEGLCQTAGALRAAAAACEIPMSDVIQWTHAQKIVKRANIVAALALRRGLGFVAPSAWRKVALAPRPCSPRDRARACEQRCAAEFFGRKIHADFSAAFGILLCALGLNYSDLGVSV